MVKYYWVAVLIFFLNSCIQTGNLSEAEKEQIVSEVEDMFDNYHSDIKQGGLTAEFKYLDQSSDFYWVPPGYKSTLSYDSVHTILNMNANLFSEVIFKWNKLQIFPLTGEIANYSGIVEGSMTDTSGNVNSVLIIESGTVVKRSDGWKLLSGQSAVLEPDTDE